MLDHPRLAQLAGDEAGTPFLRDPDADYISWDVIPQIVESAENAAAGSTIAPVLHVDADQALPMVQ